MQWRAERVPDYIDAWNEAQARAERLEAELREARELVEQFAPRKHDTGCPLHVMHDQMYENGQPVADWDPPPDFLPPRRCNCGLDPARGVLEKGDTGPKA